MLSSDVIQSRFGLSVASTEVHSRMLDAQRLKTERKIMARECVRVLGRLTVLIFRSASRDVKFETIEKIDSAAYCCMA